MVSILTLLFDHRIAKPSKHRRTAELSKFSSSRRSFKFFKPYLWSNTGIKWKVVWPKSKLWLFGASAESCEDAQSEAYANVPSQSWSVMSPHEDRTSKIYAKRFRFADRGSRNWNMQSFPNIRSLSARGGLVKQWSSQFPLGIIYVVSLGWVEFLLLDRHTLKHLRKDFKTKEAINSDLGLMKEVIPDCFRLGMF